MKIRYKVLIFLVLLSFIFTGLNPQVVYAADEPHPYLYFTQDDLANLRTLETAPSHQPIWNNIKSWADAHISDLPPSEPVGEPSRP